MTGNIRTGKDQCRGEKITFKEMRGESEEKENDQIGGNGELRSEAACHETGNDKTRPFRMSHVIICLS